MKLVSLKQNYNDDAPKPSDAISDDYYPGLFLGEKQLEALGIDVQRVGVEMTMTASVRVSNVSESKGGARSMSFEIIEAAFSPKEPEKDAASVLFPNEKK